MKTEQSHKLKTWELLLGCAFTVDVGFLIFMWVTSVDDWRDLPTYRWLWLLPAAPVAVLIGRLPASFWKTKLENFLQRRCVARSLKALYELYTILACLGIGMLVWSAFSFLFDDIVGVICAFIGIATCVVSLDGKLSYSNEDRQSEDR